MESNELKLSPFWNDKELWRSATDKANANFTYIDPKYRHLDKVYIQALMNAGLWPPKPSIPYVAKVEDIDYIEIKDEPKLIKNGKA